MTARSRSSLFLLVAMAIGGCDDAPRFSTAEPGEAQSAGAATVNKSDRNAFSMPSANLSPSRRLDFKAIAQSSLSPVSSTKTTAPDLRSSGAVVLHGPLQERAMGLTAGYGIGGEILTLSGAGPRPFRVCVVNRKRKSAARAERGPLGRHLTR